MLSTVCHNDIQKHLIHSTLITMSPIPVILSPIFTYRFLRALGHCSKCVLVSTTCLYTRVVKKISPLSSSATWLASVEDHSSPCNRKMYRLRAASGKIGVIGVQTRYKVQCHQGVAQPGGITIKLSGYFCVSWVSEEPSCRPVSS